MSDLPRPEATRLQRPRWLDPRLLLGLLLVLVSVAAGAKVVAEADDSYAVWALRRDVGPRTALSDADLMTRKVRLEGDARAYVAADGKPPVGYLVTRPMTAGELLPRAALAEPGSVATRYVSVGVDPSVAATLTPGTVVDVWVGPAEGSTGAKTKTQVARVLEGVTVASVERGGRGLGNSGNRASVVLILDDEPAGAGKSDVARYFDAESQGDIRLVAVPKGAPS